MIDLGRYAFDVYLAYAISGLCILGLIGVSYMKSIRSIKQLKEAEERLKNESN